MFAAAIVIAVGAGLIRYLSVQHVAAIKRDKTLATHTHQLGTHETQIVALQRDVGDTVRRPSWNAYINHIDLLWTAQNVVNSANSKILGGLTTAVEDDQKLLYQLNAVNIANATMQGRLNKALEDDEALLYQLNENNLMPPKGKE